MDQKYLSLLAKRYPTVQSASSEIINLRAILHLPKGTEHFLSDLHGEYESFIHILHNASGVIRRKINRLYETSMTEKQRRELATLIYYPERKLSLLQSEAGDLDEWYRVTLYRLVEVCRVVGSKYTRSKVRKALPPDFEYIIDELLHSDDDDKDKHDYYRCIIEAILQTGRADAFIVAISKTIQRLAIDRLHIIGDIYDRGPGAHIILDELCSYHQVDIQWGNHDIVWMGAAAGNPVCALNAVCLCAKYNNFDILEEGYGVSLRRLSAFAQEMYGGDPCLPFMPKLTGEAKASDAQLRDAARMHKAAAVIMFKQEHALIARHPEYRMDDRLVLGTLDLRAGTVRSGGKTWALRDTFFPTVSPDAPWALTQDEQRIADGLCRSFARSERLRKHARFLFSHGGMALKTNGNLLYHGCIPMEEDGSFSVIELDGQSCAGKSYIEYCDRTVRNGYFAPEHSPERRAGQDFFWYLWCCPRSPLFGKTHMATFERYFIEDAAAWEEGKNPYYALLETEDTARAILLNFGLDPDSSHIINGHVPVKVKKGESPIKAGGRLLVIDGGLSRPYQPTTGIAGYTLLFSSHEMMLVSHEPFQTASLAVSEGLDIRSTPVMVERMPRRLLVGDTDNGRELTGQIADLQDLVKAYRQGLIRESPSGR